MPGSAAMVSMLGVAGSVQHGCDTKGSAVVAGSATANLPGQPQGHRLAGEGFVSDVLESVIGDW